MKDQGNLQIVRTKKEDMAEIAQFFKEHFYPYEPLNMSLQREAPKEIPFISVRTHELSFKAVSSLGSSKAVLLGAVVNTEISPDIKPKAVVTDEKGLKIRKLLQDLDEKAKLWDAVNNEPHFNIVAVAVDKKYSGKEIAHKLIEESIKLAKSLKYNYVTIECSSFYSARIAEKLGFELLAEIVYSEYLDEDNEQIFKVTEPHTAIRKYIKRL